MRLPKRLRSRRDQPAAHSRRQRRLHIQTLENRRLLAADPIGQPQVDAEDDVSGPLADITGMWVSVGNREYFTSEKASVTIDMVAGESLQISGIRYGLDETVRAEDGVIAFEAYVRREHGAAAVGSYDYTDGRFGDPVEADLVAGDLVTHPGFDSGWEFALVDNRVAVVAIRYFGEEFVIEDRMFVDVNVVEPGHQLAWTEAVEPVRGDWTRDEEGNVEGDSRNRNRTGITVIETRSQPGERFEVGVKAKTVEENTWANGFVVVDYRGKKDFVYAGLRSIADQWVIGHFDGNFNDLASIDADIEPDQFYDIRVAVDGSHVALAADGVFRVSHDFDRLLGEGDVGLANQYASTQFTDFHLFRNTPDEPASETPTIDPVNRGQAKKAERETQQESFGETQGDEPFVHQSDGTSEQANPHVYSLNFNHQDDGSLETIQGDTELVAGQLHLIPDNGDTAISVLDEQSLPERNATRVYATIRADEFPGRYQNGFIVFDYQSPDDFKYAGAWAGQDRWTIGQVADGQWTDHVTVDETIVEGAAYELQIWIEDSTLTLLVEGQSKLVHTFDQSIAHGQIGVASKNARTRFDQVAVMQLHRGIGDAGIENADVTDAVMSDWS